MSKKKSAKKSGEMPPNELTGGRFFTGSLIKWHHSGNNRQMPWKGEKDPYKIWLSEIILQQTRVAQGMDYYLRIVKAYPTVEQLAAAKDANVFKLWEGLGYYSRCRNLCHVPKELYRFLYPGLQWERPYIIQQTRHVHSRFFV